MAQSSPQSIPQREQFFHQLLTLAKIPQGARVLDVGCGMGDISALVAQFTGKNGHVVGVDSSAYFVEMAKNKHPKLTFLHMDLLNLPENLGQFDLIVGRRILMYLPNPLAVIEKLKTHLTPNGKMIFQESLINTDGLNADFPISQRILDYMKQTVLVEKGDVRIGEKLYALCRKAGLNVAFLRSDWLLQTAETGTDLLFVLPAMLPRMTALGLLSAEEGENLAQHLQAEWQSANAVFYRDWAFGVCASL